MGFLQTDDFVAIFKSMGMELAKKIWFNPYDNC